MDTIIGIIPCRAGSKRIPSKNLYPLNGIPLFEYTIKAALDSNLDDVVISSDSFNYVHKLCKFIVRPKELASDTAQMIDVVKDVLETYEISFGKKVDAICLLQPTSPLRTAEDINKALAAFKDSNVNSLVSGYYMGLKTNVPYDKHAPKHFQRNGAIFLTKRELIDKGMLWDEYVYKYEMPFSRSIDIDEPDDMRLAEALIRGGILNPKEVKA